MRFVAEKDILQKGLHSVQNAVASRSTLPILSNILLETQNNTLQISATDLDVLGITTAATVKTIEEGSGTIPAKRISDIIKELPNAEVVVTMKKNNMFTVESGNSVFKIIGLPKEGFPQLPTPTHDNKTTIPQASLKRILQRTTFAVSHDETRYVLNGLYVSINGDTLHFVATDGRRLALIEHTINTTTKIKTQAIIPSKTTTELLKTIKEEGDIEIYLEQNQVFFKTNETTIISRLIEGEYPDYQQVLPKEKGERVVAEKEGFYSTMKRASLLSTPESTAVKIELLKNKMVVSKTTPEIGEFRDELSVEYAGPTLTIGFNPNYLMDVLRVLEGETVEMEVVSAAKPALFKEERYLYLVLPMQI
ncbi:MAG: DNA polymerase III subunit beta [Candidatus Omnitrophica bacterium]|nr:DNA polymerase III subunit beta [Candidatus Omnitrophota bacterium]